MAGGSDLKNFPKIKFYDVEIEFNNDGNADENNLVQHDYEMDEEDDDFSSQFFGLEVNKIKIGRIEFTNTQNEDGDDQDDDK